MASHSAAMRQVDELLDPRALEALIEDCGADMLALLVDSFAEEGQKHLAALDRAAESRDAPGAARALHALRGAALSFGLVSLVSEMSRIERAAQAGAIPDIAARDGVRVRLTASVSALQDWCAAAPH